MSALLPHLPRTARDTIRQFLRAHAGPPVSEGAILGLSGGIDSALVARLACDALGPERVLGVLLPGEGVADDLTAETLAYADSLGMAHREVPIAPFLAAFRRALPEVTDRVTLGNAVARFRMVVNYSLARDAGRRVLGTGNKSELLLGYFTKYGDGGVDLLPIGDLYKTQVRELARDLGLPRPILERAPTAGLWEGQTDEAELGLPYETIDRILLGLEQLRGPAEIAERTGIARAEVDAIVERVGQTRHKRRLAPVAKIGLRTVGLDWRE